MGGEATFSVYKDLLENDRIPFSFHEDLKGDGEMTPFLLVRDRTLFSVCKELLGKGRTAFSIRKELMGRDRSPFSICTDERF